MTNAKTGGRAKPDKIMQTKYGKGNGNCAQACVAGLLNMNLEDVPDFASASGIEWWDSLYGWCIENSYGLILLDANTKHLITNTFGIGVCKIKESDDETHAVILQYSLDQKGEQWTYKAELYHDPNPKGMTILEVTHHIFIIPIAEKHRREGKDER